MIDTPCVVIDHNSKTAIVVRSGRKYIHVIPMKSGKLTVKRLTPRQYEQAGYTKLEMDIDKALDKFLLHAGGYTDTAKKELEALRWKPII
jgi:hypothetical protein